MKSFRPALLMLACIVSVASSFVETLGTKTTSTTFLNAKKKEIALEEPPKAETFRKSEFISSIAAKTGMTKVNSEKAFEAVLDTIVEEVSNGKKISILGFGSFKLTHRAARKGRNPRTGEEIDIPASNTPSFTASKNFKEKCNPR
mmetsp:Transcript_12558/g.15791  ORF Transcript_12558/g.15791 Transcript_12558/m.15791 type:complete len:145 (-) Transcript_12558:57-491(-)|eukprot:CAMPEP_0172495608 /NCGR_PEP_ID=MMETSP1066-20121228/72787_1 /TAXON_ID=671091 /ORGANISM="Coscinodiscus wailesii, Strain CCMP2513" /LENGTH=144 /DNA_ID=CAMNT_0013267389 /DNA_START=175 /DNA_END=609 /DNA_ORIENTATION=+